MDQVSTCAVQLVEAARRSAEGRDLPDVALAVRVSSTSSAQFPPEAPNAGTLGKHENKPELLAAALKTPCVDGCIPSHDGTIRREKDSPPYNRLGRTNAGCGRRRPLGSSQRVKETINDKNIPSLMRKSERPIFWALFFLGAGSTRGGQHSHQRRGS